MLLTKIVSKNIKLSKSIENNPRITGIDYDSRKIKKGMMFAAISGDKLDGIDFCDNALKAGAKSILCSKKDLKKIINKEANILTTNNVRLAVSFIVKKLYPKQPTNIVAITGTNGKTSIAFYLRSIWKAANTNSASIGTLGISYQEKKIPTNLTTPDPIDLHKKVDALKRKKIKNIALEASSHGIDQNRIDSLNINRAIFSNFSRDHLDYHKTLSEYFKAKRRLFSEILSNNGIAIVNNNCKYGKKIEDVCKKRKIKIITYGSKTSDCKINTINFFNSFSKVSISILNKSYIFKCKLLTYYQIENLICAMITANSYKVPIKKIIKWVATIKEPPGRLEKIVHKYKNATIFIDYAHTPEALKVNLIQLKKRLNKKGSLKVLFGCGGNRDKGKRVLMAKLASKLADNVYITDDNPRFEDPKKIRDQIFEHCKNAIVIGDRKKAITLAVNKLEKYDVLLVAGKGHENYQEIKGKRTSFNDKEVVLSVMKKVEAKCY